MAKGNSKAILLGSLALLGVGYGIKTAYEKKQSVKYLRVGIASADKFLFRAETASVEFDLALFMQNIGSFELEVKDFVGKAFLNGKEFGFVNATKPVQIKPKTNSTQTVRLVIPVPNLIREIGISVYQLIGRQENKKRKFLATAVRFEGTVTLAGNTQVSFTQTLNI